MGKRVLSRLCNSLEMFVFVTRSDGATFILYNGVTNLTKICDEFHQVETDNLDQCDLFELDFEKMELPTSGACSAEWRAGRRVYIQLRLRADTGEGGVSLEGGAEIRYLMDDGDMHDDDVLGYLESYAPF